MKRWLMRVLVGLFLSSVAVLLLFFGDAQANTLRFEIAKALLQLGIVSVIGAVVSLVVYEYQRERQVADKMKELSRKDLEYREDLLKSTLSKTMAAYSAIKKARRLLRARALAGEGDRKVVSGTAYDLYMDMINDAQLEIENLARDIETSAPAFTHSTSLKNYLWQIDSHLGKLISEYEEVRPKFQGKEPIKELSEIGELKKFMAPSKGSDFEKQVVFPYHKIQEGIRADLLHPQIINRG